MSLNLSSLLTLCFLLAFQIFTTIAFNITKILDDHPDFSNFNSFLTQTRLSSEINNRRTITVLVVDNGNMGQLSGKSTDFIKKVLSLHVILDYYDVPKLQTLPKKTAKLTTLFQTTGDARGLLGFLNATDMDSHGVAFGSAVAGSGLNSNLIKAVVAQPYNISILQVSSVIIPQDIENTGSSSHSPTSSPKQSPTPESSPAPTAEGDAPAPSEDEASTPSAETPAALSPEADGPVADADAADASLGTRACTFGLGLLALSAIACGVLV